ncbi:MAG TPA: peptidase domain-containing ABC transporter [Stellaceae bacterium]|nr:peptidase domain-containing ABC transporter [Stellaceae bacterium]
MALDSPVDEPLGGITGLPATREGSPSSLLGALVIVARYRQTHLSAEQLVHDHLLGPGEPAIDKFIQVAEASGLRAEVTRVGWSDLFDLGTALPAIVLLKNGSAMVLMDAAADPQRPTVRLVDPNAHDDAPLNLDEMRFGASWTGEIVLVKRDYRLRDENQPFSFRLVFGQVLRDRKSVRDLGIAAVSLSVLAVAPIMFWRLLLDHVLYYGSLATFWALCAMMAVLVVFDTAFGYLRRFIVARIVMRVEARMSTYIFNRLINLPMDYFERTTVGEVAHNIHEFHKIREFLVAGIFGTALDSIVLVIFLPIMFAFSAILTFYVLGLSLLICLWIVVMLPVMRRKSSLVVHAEIAKGTLLIESLHGIRTVKSLALDALHRHEWDVRVARAAAYRYDEQLTANVLQTVINPLQMLITSGVFAVAVYLFITTHQSVYVGALIAFMLLTQRVAAPLVRASSLIEQYDQARIAALLIAGVVNQPPEEGRSESGIRTPIEGHVEFQGVRFRYRGTTVPALDDVSFVIPAGTIFGIMGRSGSGKTTVTRLLQLLHSNFEGLIKIDGNDLRQIDVDHLRSSTGVVLQENFLFSGTIRQAIATAKPDATFEEVVRAARLAGAEEFIERMPRGYETFIQEGSPNLSGGQRQRLAIARALIGNPRILILDEATSALDAESEAIVNANLLRIAKGRTLIIISHRLSSLVMADAILVLERGRVYDIGRHDELIERCDIYSALWHQQNRHLKPRPSHEIIALRPGTTQ